jgi:hypothetical protein
VVLIVKKKKALGLKLVNRLHIFLLGQTIHI